MNIAWIRRIDWRKTLLVGFLIMVVSTIVHMIEASIMMPYYKMPEYYGLWSKLMMPTNGPPPPEFMIVSTIANFFTGVSLVIIYYYIKDFLPKGYWKQVRTYADLLVATSFIFFTVPSLFLFNVPLALAGSWFVSTFIIVLVSSMIIVKKIN